MAERLPRKTAQAGAAGGGAGLRGGARAVAAATATQETGLAAVTGSGSRIAGWGQGPGQERSLWERQAGGQEEKDQAGSGVLSDPAGGLSDTGTGWWPEPLAKTSH